MNFLFATNSEPANSTHAIACNTSLAVTGAQGQPGPSTAVSPTSPTTAPATGSLQDIELVIEIESSFHGVLLGLPEESAGAVLNATAILHVRKKPIRASKLTATFDGRIKVQCSDGATFGPEQYRERVLAHKDWTLWEAGANNTPTAGSGSKNHIPVGTHYYPLSIQLDGALPPTFSGKHGSIRYILSSTLLRPLFYSDISAVQEIEIKRCLVSEASRTDRESALHGASLDLGSLLVNQLSRVGISGALNDRGDAMDSAQAAELPLGPTTITHHNTHKELLRYTASSPPIAHLEGGLIQVDLALEPLPPGSYIYSIAYGLKELIYYRSSATGNLADNKSEILYPIGQQTVIIPRDQERERSMSSAGAGASTRQLLELRPCPLLTNVDIITPLIEIQHRITCNVVIVLPDPVRRRNTISGNRAFNGSSRGDNNGDQSGGFTGNGGGILRRLNLAPQPLSPNLNLIDSTGTEVSNNAVLLGEPTHSIIKPALVPATVELNDAPPPPPSSQLESTLLEFPIILTSRYPSASRIEHHAPPDPILYSETHVAPAPAQNDAIENDGDFAYQALSANSYSSSNLASSLHSRPRIMKAAQVQTEAFLPSPGLQQFVHNQEISSAIIPTTGATIQNGAGSTLTPELSESLSSSPTSTLSSNMTGRFGRDESSSSSSPSQGSPTAEHVGAVPGHGLASPGFRTELNGVQPYVRPAPQSGISAGLRAAAAASAESREGSEHAAIATTVTPLSRPPSYGRHVLQSTQTSTFLSPLPPQDELPKYEDVIDNSEGAGPETGLGITIPNATPMPMPMEVPCRSYQSSVSPRSMSPRSMGHSPVVYQSMSSSYSRGGVGRVFSSPPGSSPILPSSHDVNRGSGGFMLSRDGQGSSPQAIRANGSGHVRSGSSTSMLLSTSLARSQGSGQQSSMAALMAMTPAQSATLQQPQFPGQAVSVHRQASLNHQQQQHERQYHHHHQRQRSVGAATIMGSLGRNGGYLSQQPAPLTMSDLGSATGVPTMTGMMPSPPPVLISNMYGHGNASPPAYADVSTM